MPEEHGGRGDVMVEEVLLALQPRAVLVAGGARLNASWAAGEAFWPRNLPALGFHGFVA